MVMYLPIIIALILYFTGIPIAYALMAGTLYYFGFVDTTSKTYLLLQKFITATQSFPLLAIPFFIMAGSIMNYSGMSDKLMAFADALTGHTEGGLAQMNVLLSMLMGGCSGSANADAAMECKMLVPEMEKRGYGKGFSAAITAASSCITPIIPPGINLIVYGLIAGASVGKLFAAGYLPGFLMAGALMVAVHIIAKKRGYAPSRTTRANLKADASLIVRERLMTHGKQYAYSEYEVSLDGENASADVVSRGVAKDKSYQKLDLRIVGNAACHGHTECDSIIMDEGRILAVPSLEANNVDAMLVHEAAIGKIAGDQLIKLMTLGLTEKEAEEQIVNGFLK